MKLSNRITQKHARSYYGFSLFELLLGIAIFSILATIAYPSYQNIITRTRRNDGQTALIDLANRMEQYYAMQHSYRAVALPDLTNSPISPQGWYTLSIQASDDNHYLLAATPIGSQAPRDQRCQTLTLTNLGEEGIAPGPNGQPSGNELECWSH